MIVPVSPSQEPVRLVVNLACDYRMILTMFGIPVTDMVEQSSDDPGLVIEKPVSIQSERMYIALVAVESSVIVTSEPS